MTTASLNKELGEEQQCIVYCVLRKDGVILAPLMRWQRRQLWYRNA
jgi:hypothetical protein